MKLVDIVPGLLILEYSDKLIESLINKFKYESPGLYMEYGDDIFRFYIDRFDVIKNNPKIEEKDITQYSWNNLQKVVNKYSGKRIKAGKLNDGNVTNSELVYNQNGLRVYSANSTRSCIKYGNGYNFCISSRGDDNRFDVYSVNTTNEEGRGTPYFVFDDEKTSEKKYDVFVDPNPKKWNKWEVTYKTHDRYGETTSDAYFSEEYGMSIKYDKDRSNPGA